MIKAKTPIVNKPKSEKGAKFFAVENDIIPIRPVTHDMIMQLTEYKDEVILTEQKVETLVREHKTKNYFNKFFVRLGLYIDRLEKFLKDLKNGYIKIISQQKILLESEKSDQLLRTYRTKKTLKQIKDEDKKSKRKSIDLFDPKDTETIALLAAALGLQTVTSAVTNAGVNYQPVSGQLIPKGITAIDVVSGYPITSGYGPRWGGNHGGIDVGVPIGTMFALKLPSQVVAARLQDPSNSRVGYGLVVDTYVPSLGKMFRFGHLSSVSVRTGETVPLGKVLGKSGSSGKSTGPHFHIEVHTVGSYQEALQKSGYGNEDPSDFMKYVVLGDTVKNADGGIETRKIMVGEADTELVIPMSQMPLFIQGMMEEKIRSLNPYYNMSSISGTILPKSSGKTNQKYSAGAIVQAAKIIEHHEALSSLTPGENDFIKEGKISVGSSKTKWNYIKTNPSKNIIYPYQNTGDVPTVGWGSTYYFDEGSRKVSMGDSPISLNRADKLLKSYVQKDILGYYPKVFKYWNKFTDSQKASLLSLGYNMGKFWIHGTNFFNLMQQGKIAQAAMQIPNDIPDRRAEERRMLLSGPQVIMGSKIVGKKKVGSGIPFIPPFMYRPPQKKASLNQIDGSRQMEVASAIQNEMEYTNDMIDITYLYKPIVKIPVDLA